MSGVSQSGKWLEDGEARRSVTESRKDPFYGTFEWLEDRLEVLTVARQSGLHAPVTFRPNSSDAKREPARGSVVARHLKGNERVLAEERKGAKWERFE